MSSTKTAIGTSLTQRLLPVSGTKIHGVAVGVGPGVPGVVGVAPGVAVLVTTEVVAVAVAVGVGVPVSAGGIGVWSQGWGQVQPSQLWQIPSRSHTVRRQAWASNGSSREIVKTPIERPSNQASAHAPLGFWASRFAWWPNEVSTSTS